MNEISQLVFVQKEFNTLHICSASPQCPVDVGVACPAQWCPLGRQRDERGCQTCACARSGVFGEDILITGELKLVVVVVVVVVVHF